MEGVHGPEKRRLMQRKRYSPIPTRPARVWTNNPKDDTDLFKHSVYCSCPACEQDEDITLDNTVNSAFTSVAKDNLLTGEDSSENQYLEPREQCTDEDTARHEELSFAEGTESSAIHSDDYFVRNGDYYTVRNDEYCVRNDEDYVRNDEDCVRNDEDCVRKDECCVRNDRYCERNDDYYVRNDDYYVRSDDSCVRHDEYCVRSDEYYVRNDESCVRNDECCLRNDDYYVRHGEDCVRNDDCCVRNEDSCVRNDEYHVRNDEYCVRNDEYCVGNDDYCVRDDDYRAGNDEHCVRDYDYCANKFTTPEKDKMGHNSRLAEFYENLVLGTNNYSNCEYPIQRGDSDADSSPDTKKRKKNYTWNEPKPQDPKRKRTQDKRTDFIWEQNNPGFLFTSSRKSMNKGKGIRPRSYAHTGRTSSSFNHQRARHGMNHRDSLSGDSDNSRSGDSHSDDPDLQLAMQISRYSGHNHQSNATRANHLSPEDAFNMPSTSSSSDSAVGSYRHGAPVCSSPDPPSLFHWKAGDLLWARLTAHLWLPCIVCKSDYGYYIQVKVEKDAVVTEYHVQFLDRNSNRCWVTSSCLKKYGEAGMQVCTRREKSRTLTENSGVQMEKGLWRRNEHVGHHLDEHSDDFPQSDAEWAQAVKEAEEAYPLSGEERLHRFACRGHSDSVQDVLNGNPAVYAPDFNVLPCNAEPQFSDDEQSS